MSVSPLFCDHCGAANTPPATRCFSCGWAISDLQEPPASLHNGRYHILSTLGQGGYGAVYEATDTAQNGRFVAIKAVNMHGLGAGQIIEATETFNREVSILSELNHPNLPQLYENFSDTEHWYLVMDFIEGQTLEEYAQKCGGNLPFAEVLALAEQICRVLDYLHTRQPPVIFRDVKPANMLRTSTGKIFLIDFGIARRFKPGQRRDTTLLGSPGYAAPEQYGQAQTTPQTDIYSLGVTLWQLLSGQDPASVTIFPDGLDTLALVPDISDQFKQLLASMLDPEPEKRPASLKEVIKRLNAPQHRDSGTQLGYASVQPGPAAISTATPAPSNQSTARQIFQPSPAPARKRGITRRKALVGLGSALGVAALGGGAWMWHLHVSPLVYTGHGSTVNALAWSPNGKSIASGDDNGYVLIWDSSTGKTLVTCQPTIVNNASKIVAGYVTSISWSPDGQSVLAGYNDALVIWDAHSGKTTFATDQIAGPAAWSPDGKLIAACQVSNENDHSVLIFDSKLPIGVNFPLATMDYGVPAALAWSPDSQLLATAISNNIDDDSGGIAIYQSLGNRLVDTIAGGTVQGSGAFAVAWSPDGQYFMGGSTSGTAGIYSIEDGTQEYVIDDPAQVLAVAWAPLLGQQKQATADSAGAVTIWNDGEQQDVVINAKQPIRCVAWSPGGQFIAAGGDDQTVQVVHI